MTNVRKGLIDPDTPKDAYSRKGADGGKQVLVVRIPIFLTGSEANVNSFLMNSTLMVELSTTVTTHFFKLSISGTVRPKIWRYVHENRRALAHLLTQSSGTILMQSQRGTAP